jgi:hypothetical protein
VGGVSTGRTRTTSNTLVPGASYRLDEKTSLRAFGTWNMGQFDTPASGAANTSRDTNTYGAEGYVDHRLTRRLTLSGGYAFEYLDVDGSPTVTTHTPLVGGSYRLTQTMTASAWRGLRSRPSKRFEPSVVRSSRHWPAIRVGCRGHRLLARPRHHGGLWQDFRDRHRLRPNTSHDAGTRPCPRADAPLFALGTARRRGRP